MDMLQALTCEEAEGLARLDHVVPIKASDSEIEAAVQDADLPALLAALAILKNDDRFLAEELRPPPVKMGGSIKPQGGMSEEAQAKARRLAANALIAYRDEGCPAPDLSAPLLERAMKFLARAAGPEYLPLLKHELGLPRDMGAPDWRKSEVAPDRPFRVAVIGAGLSGVAAAYRLKQAGLDYKVFEKNPDVGGVWWNNIYPGCRLDTPNFAYSFSFAQKQDWPDQFSRQDEIRRYISQVTDDVAVRDHIAFNTEVVSLIYDEASCTWTLQSRSADGTMRDERFNAVITAVGLLNRPAIPKIPGMDYFKGKIFHSAQWPPGLDIKNKRVAVVGTGASAYQIVPTIVNEVAELTVFQRNPPWMLPTPNYHDSIKQGMSWLLHHVPFYGRWFRFWQFWIAAEGRFPLVVVESDWEHPVSVGRDNESLRLDCLQNLEAQFADRPDLLEKMTPNYPPGAKRMLRDNGVWASALKQPDVNFVTDGIKQIHENSIETSDGAIYPVDIVVLATGFLASDYLEPIRILGKGGRDLHQWWQGDCRAYLGITVPAFPNLFLTGGPNTGLVVNGSAIFTSECCVEYALSAIGQLLATGNAVMDVRDDLFNEFNARVDAANLTKAWGVATVSSWYRNSFGRASQTWPFPLLDYWRITEKANLDDYNLTRWSRRVGGEAD